MYCNSRAGQNAYPDIIQITAKYLIEYLSGVSTNLILLIK